MQTIFKKIKKLVKTWNRRYLTCFCKITVIKTNILSQYVHLLSSIQKSDSFVKAVKIFYVNFYGMESQIKSEDPLSVQITCSRYENDKF